MRLTMPRQAEPEFNPHGSDASAWAMSRWTAAAYLCIGLALVLVVSMAIWGVFHDLQIVRSTLIQSEMGRLRSHAARTVSIIQDQIKASGKSPALDKLPDSEYLRNHWARNVLRDESRLYATIIDNQGKVVMHSDPSREGLSTGPAWYDSVVAEASSDEDEDDVVDTRNAALTGGKRAIDVRVPIFHEEREIGTYHSGLSFDWLTHELEETQGRTKRVWGWLLTIMAAIVVAAGVSLFHITRRLTVFSEAVKVARVRRFAEIGQLMAGIVHEIRNPLNAMRLNLHVLARHQQRVRDHREDGLNGDLGDPEEVIRETNREIERVEGLMRILLGYARPDQPQNEHLDVRQELRSILGFLKPSLERAEVVLRAEIPDEPVMVHMDRDRLRQIVLNLVNNAKDATGHGGHIEVRVVQHDGVVEIVVADDGPGVPPGEREHIFEPFYSTKEFGTGLGLALVKRYVEDVGGSITCELRPPHGAMFRIHLSPIVSTKVEQSLAMLSTPEKI
jgi:two-component system sensor histidine kinase HydH